MHYRQTRLSPRFIQDDMYPSLRFGISEKRLYAASATPTHTSKAEIQRRLSTSSFRNNFAKPAVRMKVSEAETGATKLASPQESAASKLKKATAMQAIAR